MGCKYHLLCDIDESGTIYLRAGQKYGDESRTRNMGRKVTGRSQRSQRRIPERDDMSGDAVEEFLYCLAAAPDTCALDVADRGGLTLDEVGKALGVTRERVRQIEDRALVRVRRNAINKGVEP